jgi:putative transposase
VTAELRRRGFVINHKRVARIMREHPMEVLAKPRKPRQKQIGDLGAPFPFIAKGFIPDGPNQLWVTDITYIRLRSGFLYLSVMIDAWSRKVVGYAASTSIDVRLVATTLDRAYSNRQPEPGLIHHSDQGAQYTAKNYQLKLEEYGMIGSMSRKGTPTDNPRAESFMKTLKYEEVYQFGYATISDVKERLPVFLEEIYNQKRIHSALGYLPPDEFEKQFAERRSI